MSDRLSLFLLICLSVCLYVGQSSVCRLLCLLLSIHRSAYMSYCVIGRVPIYFSLCVVHCANPILLIPSVLLLVLYPSTYIAVRYYTLIFVVL